MKRINRYLAMGLALTLTIGLAACGTAKGGDGTGANSSSEVTEELVPDYSYEAEYISLPEEMNLYNSMLVGSKLYSLSGEMTEDAYITKLVKCPIQDGELGQSEDVLVLDNNTSCNTFCADAEDNLYLLLQKWPEVSEEEEQSSKASYHLIKYDKNKVLCFDEDISEAFRESDYFYASSMAVDGKGNIYIAGNSEGIYLFDPEGKNAGNIQMTDGWIYAMGVSKGGNVYVGYMNYTSEGGSNVLAALDFDGKKLGESYPGFLDTNGNGGKLSAGMDSDFLAYDQNCVYEYSLESKEAVKLLTWLDCDMDGSSVNSVSYGADGTFLVLLRDWESGTAELAKMKKVRTEDIAKRENITFGVLYNDNGLSRKIVEFNKNNTKYRVRIKAYMDLNNLTEDSYRDALTNFTNDLISGNGPDIIDLEGMDIENLVEKGVLEDLRPYLKSSTVVSEKDVFPEILQGATYGDVLAYIPTSFVLNTLAAKASLVGEEPGWTCKEMMELSKSHPNADLLEYIDKETALNLILMLGKNHFIDSEKNECHFDTDEFKQVLQFAGTFPEEISYDQRLTPFRLADDSLLVATADIYDFREVQSVLAYFGEEKVTFIGYPTFDGGNGSIVIPSNSYGIFSKSECKEGAWEVLEMLLDVDVENDWSFWGFSTLISKYEKQKEAALQVEYVYDENGEILLDENGEPVYEGGSGWTMVGDDGEEWSYQYRPIKAEEVELVERLLTNATVLDVNSVYGMNADSEIGKIIKEEASAYFKGSKSADEVASIIQNRINLYLKENE